MTGEMLSIDPVTGIDSDGEKWYLHAAIAKALGGKVMPFDKYQGPYVLIGRESDDDITRGEPPYSQPIQGLGIVRLWLVVDEELYGLSKWYNEANDKTSKPFLANETEKGMEVAVAMARQVL